MSKLDLWYEKIKNNQTLTLPEVKVILNLANQMPDPKKKDIYINEVINGTLYVLYNYLKNNDFEMFNSQSYDMDDLINSFLEVWIEDIKSGRILKVSHFSYLINRPFLKRVIKSLGVNDDILNYDIGIDNKSFIAIFKNYLALKNKFNDVSFNELLESLKNNQELFNLLKNNQSLYLIICAIYKRLNIKEEFDFNVASTAIEKNLPLFVEMGINEKLNASLKQDTMEDEIILNKYYDDIFKVLNNIPLKEREKMVIDKWFGFDDEPLTFREIGKDLGISHSCAFSDAASAFKKIHKDKTLIKVYERS